MAIRPTNILPEHAAPWVGERTEAEQKPEELKAVKLVEDLFKRAKRARTPHDQDWLDFWKMFVGKQWTQKRPSYRHSEVLNFIFSEIQTVIPILTDNRPNIETLPEDPSDYAFSEIMTHILRSKWDTNNWSYTLAECILDSCIYGTAIGQVPFVQEKLDGLGDFDFKSVDPIYFFPDPSAVDINDDECDYVILARPIDIGKLKRLYPDKAHLIKSDIGEMYLSKNFRDQLEEVTVKSPVDNKVLSLNDRSPEAELEQERVLLVACWMKSEEMVEQKLTMKDEQGAEKEAFQEIKKYPNGRYLLVANHILLKDDAIPHVDGKFEFAKLVDHIMPHQFWGMGEVKQLQSPQVAVNKIFSYILDVLMLMGNPIWLVDSNSGVDTDNIFNIPGAIIEKNPGTHVSRVEGVQLQPYIVQTLELLMNRIMDKISGVHDVSRGVSPSSASSGTAIDLLQEAAQTKLRAKSRNIEFFLKKIGDLMVSRILQYYTVPRIIRITNDDRAAKYFKFFVKEDTDETGQVQKIASVEEFQLNQQTSAYEPMGIKEYQIKSGLDVRVSTGSTLPFAKAQRAAMAERFFDKGIIGPEELLEAVEYPGKEKILENLKMRQSQMPPAQEQPGAVETPPAA